METKIKEYERETRDTFLFFKFFKFKMHSGNITVFGINLLSLSFFMYKRVGAQKILFDGYVVT